MEIFNTLLFGRTPYQFTALCVDENPQSIFSVTLNVIVPFIDFLTFFFFSSSCLVGVFFVVVVFEIYE